MAFDHQTRHAAIREEERGRQTVEAATDDDDGWVRRHDGYVPQNACQRRPPPGG
jgi:hypothetical protein